MGTPFLRSLPLFALALASAHCGGKTTGPEVVGDAAPPAHDAFTSPDGRTVRFDSGVGCPSGAELTELGSSCSWAGVCTLDVDTCGGLELPCVCQGGAVGIEPNVDYSCITKGDAGEGPPTECPTPTEVGSGATCSGTMQCEGEVPECGGVQTNCPCVNGQFQCPPVSCGMNVPDAAAPDASTTCPSDQADAELGQPCDFVGVCMLYIGSCTGLELPCVCEGGAITLEPGYMCNHEPDAG